VADRNLHDLQDGRRIAREAQRPQILLFLGQVRVEIEPVQAEPGVRSAESVLKHLALGLISVTWS